MLWQSEPVFNQMVHWHAVQQLKSPPQSSLPCMLQEDSASDALVHVSGAWTAMCGNAARTLGTFMHQTAPRGVGIP